jgi:hypothetical protein
MTQDDHMRADGTPDPAALWRRQAMPVRIPTPEEIRGRLSGLDRRTRLRNLIEYATAALAVLGAGGIAALEILLGGPDLGTLGIVLIGLGAIVIVFQLRARTRGSAIDGTQPSIDAYRALLRRERDALASVWLWYVGPMLPGVALVYCDAALKVKGNGLIFVGAVALVTIIFFAWVIAINRRGAREMDAELQTVTAEQDD